MHCPLVIRLGVRTANHLSDQVILAAGAFLRCVVMVLQVRLLGALHSLIETIHSRMEALLLVAWQLAHPVGSVHGVVIQVDR